MQRTFQTQDLRRVIRRTYEKPDMRQLTLNAGLRYKLALQTRRRMSKYSDMRSPLVDASLSIKTCVTNAERKCWGRDLRRCGCIGPSTGPRTVLVGGRNRHRLTLPAWWAPRSIGRRVRRERWSRPYSPAKSTG